jgi:hypothetical protein
MELAEIDWGHIHLALMFWAFEGDWKSLGGTQWTKRELLLQPIALSLYSE